MTYNPGEETVEQNERDNSDAQENIETVDSPGNFRDGSGWQPGSTGKVRTPKPVTLSDIELKH